MGVFLVKQVNGAAVRGPLGRGGHQWIAPLRGQLCACQWQVISGQQPSGRACKRAHLGMGRPLGPRTTTALKRRRATVGRPSKSNPQMTPKTPPKLQTTQNVGQHSKKPQEAPKPSNNLKEPSDCAQRTLNCVCACV